MPLFNSDLANYNIGYLPSYLSNTGKTNEEVSGDITLKLGDTEYTGDNIVYNYDTDSDTYYITLTKNNLDVIRIEYHDTQYSCYISYYDDTGTLDHTDSAQDPSSYPLYMHLNREVYNINPLYNTFFDSLGGGNNIDVDYTIEDNQMIIAMTCGENSANVTIPIVDNVAY